MDFLNQLSHQYVDPKYMFVWCKFCKNRCSGLNAGGVRIYRHFIKTLVLSSGYTTTDTSIENSKQNFHYHYCTISILCTAQGITQHVCFRLALVVGERQRISPLFSETFYHTRFFFIYNELNPDPYKDHLREVQ